MTDPTVDWVPVAGLLEAASSELEVGQLLHTSVFSLFEAMSAVEIGNPKMDAGESSKQGMPASGSSGSSATVGSILHSSRGLISCILMGSHAHSYLHIVDLATNCSSNAPKITAATHQPVMRKCSSPSLYPCAASSTYITSATTFL